MKILVCEDNRMTLRTMEYALKKAGYSVLLAEDGDRGIDLLEEEDVDLVITDINMPYTKGLELVRHINKEMERRIPVIVVTGITNRETRDHAMELGAKDYLTKPFDLDEMVDRVRSIIG